MSNENTIRARSGSAPDVFNPDRIVPTPDSVWEFPLRRMVFQASRESRSSKSDNVKAMEGSIGSFRVPMQRSVDRCAAFLQSNTRRRAGGTSLVWEGGERRTLE